MAQWIKQRSFFFFLFSSYFVTQILWYLKMNETRLYLDFTRLGIPAHPCLILLVTAVICGARQTCNTQIFSFDLCNMLFIFLDASYLGIVSCTCLCYFLSPLLVLWGSFEYVSIHNFCFWFCGFDLFRCFSESRVHISASGWSNLSWEILIRV